MWALQCVLLWKCFKEKSNWKQATIISKILVLMQISLRGREKPGNKMVLSVEMKTFKGVKHKNKQSLSHVRRRRVSAGASDKETFPVEVQLGE